MNITYVNLCNRHDNKLLYLMQMLSYFFNKLDNNFQFLKIFFFIFKTNIIYKDKKIINYFQSLLNKIKIKSNILYCKLNTCNFAKKGKNFFYAA